MPGWQKSVAENLASRPCWSALQSRDIDVMNKVDQLNFASYALCGNWSISTSILSDVLAMANYKTLRSTKYSNMSLTPHLHYRHVHEVKRIATKGRPSQILHNVSS